MSKVLFSTDSASDITPELIEKHNINIVNLTITMGDQIYSGAEVTAQMMYDYYAKTKKLPKTSAVNAQEFVESWTLLREREGNYPIIQVSLGDKISLTYKNAVEAAKLMPDVYVIDSATLSSGIALLVLYSIDLHHEGKSPAEICQIVQKKAYQGKGGSQTSFVIETLEFLYKGGRCSVLKLLGANLLKIRPTIGVVSGKMDVVDKMRGKQSDVIKRYIHKLKDDYGDRIDLTRAFITHTLSDPGFEDEALALAKEIFGFKEVHHQIAGSTITTHCGKNTLGLLFLIKDE